ncbi:MAG: TIGR01620 family protein [Succinivibrionaceae bacterium]
MNNKLKSGFVLKDNNITRINDEAPNLGRNIKGFTVSPEDVKSSVVNKFDDIENTTTISYSSIIDNDYYKSEPDNQTTKFWSSPILWIILFFLGFGGLQTYNSIIEAFTVNSFIGYLWSSILLFLFIAVLYTVYREFGVVLLLKENDKNRQEVYRISENGTGKDAIAHCKKMASFAKCTENSSYKKFKKGVEEYFSPLEVFNYYEKTVLKEQDKKVKEIIIKRSTENGIVVALSPISWLDMLFTLARSMRMIREISEVYGFKCGYWGRIQLYRRVFKNLIFIGVTDLATDALIDVFGAGVTTKISVGLGQGIAATIYSSRLGYMTAKATRPIPLHKEILSLGNLRKELLLNGDFANLLRENCNKN